MNHPILVIPAKAGTQGSRQAILKHWIPAFAGMTIMKVMA